MARPRSKQGNSNTNEGEATMAATDTAKGSLTSLKMIEVADDVLDATRGGRGHGEYDTFLDMFVTAGIRGTQVGFAGVKSNSIKTGLKSAIKRAEESGKIEKDTLEVRGKDDNVYLVRKTPAAA